MLCAWFKNIWWSMTERGLSVTERIDRREQFPKHVAEREGTQLEHIRVYHICIGTYNTCGRACQNATEYEGTGPLCVNKHDQTNCLIRCGHKAISPSLSLSVCIYIYIVVYIYIYI